MAPRTLVQALLRPQAGLAALAAFPSALSRIPWCVCSFVCRQTRARGGCCGHKLETPSWHTRTRMPDTKASCPIMCSSQTATALCRRMTSWQAGAQASWRPAWQATMTACSWCASQLCWSANVSNTLKALHPHKQGPMYGWVPGLSSNARHRCRKLETLCCGGAPLEWFCERRLGVAPQGNTHFISSTECQRGGDKHPSLS